MLLAALLAADIDAQAAPRWWLGFIDQQDRAFLEIPPDRRACAERDALVRRSGAGAGAVVLSGRAAASHIGGAGRLTFGVSDLAGHGVERVLTRVVAIAREDEKTAASQQQACWYLAEAGAEAPGYRALEDRIAIGVHPPRPLAPRRYEDGWRSFGGAPDAVGSDSRFLPESEAPAELLARVRESLAGAAQFHAQAFEARLAPGAKPAPLRLIGGIARGDGEPDGPGTFDTVNLIVRDTPADGAAAVLFRAGPSGGIGRDRAGSFAAQVVAVVDLDGDGVDEVLLRARHYAGGSLMVLRWNGASFAVARRGAYEGE